jgi:hypothetical protein
MTRLSRNALIGIAATALVAIGGGFALGRSLGERQPPGLVVQPVDRIDRPVVGPEIPVPTPIEIPARPPR